MLIAFIALAIAAVVVATVKIVQALKSARKDADKNFSNKPVKESTQPCPLAKSISGQFKELELKCGLEGHVQADGVNISNGADTTFSISRERDGKALVSVNGPMNGQKVRELPWLALRPTDNVNTDVFVFNVAADGKSAISTNHFKFFEYPNYAAETKTINCRSGRFGGTGKFDIKYENNTVIVTTKIKLLNRLGAKGDTPMPAIGSAVSDTDKAAMKADIEGKLSEKVKLHRDLCEDNGCGCPKTVVIKVDFVESGEHHEVNLFQGPGRANASNWTRVKTRANSWAHETGHLLGWFDEYASGAVGTSPRWIAAAPTHVMGSGLIVPPEYSWDFRDWFIEKTSEQWTAKAS